MTKFLWVLAALFVIQGFVNAQENDVTEIPFEMDIKPVESKLDDENIIEGSGNVALEEKIETNQSLQPQLEPFITPEKTEDEGPSIIGEDEQINNSSPELRGDPVLEEKVTNQQVQPSVSHMMVIDDDKPEDNSSPEITCPKPCLCSIEGDASNLVVNCAGYSLTEFPSPLDARTSTLNLNNNKLTEIPKNISALKNLKILNANDNSIMELAAGSVSELPALVTLKLANNRLIEYPQDLKNSISLTKLEELDLGGNDIRTTLTPELFSSLKSLQKVTLPPTTSDLVEDICRSFKTSLETVCVETCQKQLFDCPDLTATLRKDLLDATLPGMIAFHSAHELGRLNDTKTSVLSLPAPTVTPESNSTTTEFSLRAAVNAEPVDNKAFSSVVEVSKDTSQTEKEVKVSAKTVEIAKSGGVDKSVIGIVIAGMIVIVAVIAIKKNWSSIKKKFSSTPRPNERTTNSNGTTPEEVPLQDKSNDKLPV